MSAFLCANETISRAVACLIPLDEAPAAEKLDALGAEMLKLNYEALFQRYGDKIPKKIKFKFDYSKVINMSKIQMLKSLQCLIYQCSEGDIPETATLYKRMSEASRDLKDEIIHELPEWNSAVWG